MKKKAVKKSGTKKDSHRIKKVDHIMITRISFKDGSQQTRCINSCADFELGNIFTDILNNLR